MSLLNFRRPKCVVIKEEVSYSGKYKIFYGHHYVQGQLCFDVGAINQANGQITSRHYREDWNIDAKAEALRAYHTLAKGMKRKPTGEEDQDNSARVSDIFRRQLKKGDS